MAGNSHRLSESFNVDLHSVGWWHDAMRPVNLFGAVSIPPSALMTELWKEMDCNYKLITVIAFNIVPFGIDPIGLFKQF